MSAKGYTKTDEALNRLTEHQRQITQEDGTEPAYDNEYWANEPVLFPLVELCIQLRVPILHHAGHTMWLSAPQPRICSNQSRVVCRNGFASLANQAKISGSRRTAPENRRKSSMRPR